MAEIHFLSNISEDFFTKENTSEPESEFLYKTMSLESFLKAAKTGLWFAKPSIWQDPFEKRFYVAEQFIIEGKKKRNPLKDKFFCCCMTSIAQSEAHWNIYSRDQIGIQLKISRRKLLSFLESRPAKYHFFIGKAEYLRQRDIEGDLMANPFLKTNFNIDDDNDWIKLLLLKRKPFEYEQEVRFIVTNREKDDDKDGISIYGKKPSFISTIDSIKISPKCPEKNGILLKRASKTILRH